MITAVKIIFIIIGVMLAGFFAGVETGIYRISRFNLRIGIERKRPFYKLLGTVLSDTHGLMLSMLIGTNLSHYFVTSVVTAMFIAVAHSHHKAEFYATITMTPVFFVFSELIPKSIFVYYADYLMPRLSFFVWAGHKFFTFIGIVPLLKLLATITGKATGNAPSSQPAIVAIQRHQISQIAADTIEEGILSDAQSRIISRLINIPHIKVSDVITPLGKVDMIDVESSRRVLLAKLTQSDYARLPVYEKTTNNILGFIDVYDILNSQSDFENLREFVKPIMMITENLSVAAALEKMRNENQRIALIISAKAAGRNLGIVTIKDLVEEFIGELTHI
ncbi:MAG: CNNM domain-containing protein [Phycisphaerae bacterium]|nr:CNNM domain-containing protein [Phycisphaerae bacterium]